MLPIMVRVLFPSLLSPTQKHAVTKLLHAVENYDFQSSKLAREVMWDLCGGSFLFPVTFWGWSAVSKFIEL